MVAGAAVVGLLVACSGRQPASRDAPPAAAVAVPASRASGEAGPTIADADGAGSTVGLAASPGPTARLALAGDSSRAGPVYRTATGVVSAYDPGGRLLTVRAAGRLSRFQVAADARAWLGSHRLPVSELARHLGAEATIAFSETAGVRTTHTVRLAESERHRRAR